LNFFIDKYEVTTMPKKMQKATYVSKLRQRAEEVLEASSGDNGYLGKLSPDEMKALIHDFQVHQIELEMQNEELKRSEEELDTARARYFDFFNMAPVGFFSVNEQKLILECNLTAATLLERPQNAFIKQSITQFILKEDQDIYYLHNKQVFETKMAQEYDLRMLKSDGSALWLHLSTTAVQHAEGDTVCRIVMSNITELKQVENQLQKAHNKLEQRVKERTKELELQTRSLKDVNTALNVMLKKKK
jgi:PAS domain S-box-containing protein